MMATTVERGGSRAALALGLALVLLAGSLPFWGESSWMREFVEIACYFVFAMMWNLLAGYGGMVSIGQQAFLGLGGYAMLALLAIRDNEVAAESQGIAVWRMKLAVYVVAAFGAGIAGALYSISSATCASAPTPPSASTGRPSRSSWW